MWQSKPVQQSALVVHAPLLGTQAVPQNNRPVVGSGTQGRWLQHSPEKAQAPPGSTQAVSELQRGMPVASGWQQSLPEMQSQQSLRTLVRSPAQTKVVL